MTCLIIYRNKIEIWLPWHSSMETWQTKNGSYMCRLHVLEICRIFVYKSIHSSSSYFMSFWSVPSNFPTFQAKNAEVDAIKSEMVSQGGAAGFLFTKVSFKLAFTFLRFIRFHRETYTLIMWFLLLIFEMTLISIFFLLLGWFVWICIGTMNLILKPCKSTRICNWSKIGRAGDLVEKSEN